MCLKDKLFFKDEDHILDSKLNAFSSESFHSAIIHKQNTKSQCAFVTVLHFSS